MLSHLRVGAAVAAASLRSWSRLTFESMRSSGRGTSRFDAAWIGFGIKMAHYVEKVDNFDSGLLHLQYVLGPSSFHHLVIL